MPKKFTLVEETVVNHEGERTFYYTRMSEDDGFAHMVNDSLSYSKDDALKMFHLIVKHDGVMKKETILETVIIE
jgi:hypothetical protein